MDTFAVAASVGGTYTSISVSVCAPGAVLNGTTSNSCVSVSLVVAGASPTSISAPTHSAASTNSRFTFPSPWWFEPVTLARSELCREARDSVAGADPDTVERQQSFAGRGPAGILGLRGEKPGAAHLRDDGSVVASQRVTEDLRRHAEDAADP